MTKPNLKELKHYWQQRSPRERWLLGSLGLVMIVVGFYMLIWQPYWNTRNRLDREVPALRAALVSMREDELLVKELQQANRVVVIAPDKLKDAIEESLGRVALVGFIEKIEDNGGGRITLTASQMPFAQWVRWLERLSKEIGVATVSASITSEGEGVVRLEATLAPLTAER